MLTEQFGEQGRRAARLISAYVLIPALALDNLAEVLDELPTHLVVGADGRMRPDPDTLR